MKSTPFDISKDLIPIPFSATVKCKARNTRDVGLNWNPQTGCFVWDKQNKIQTPSPFMENIYFVLNINHFLKIFGSTAKMQPYLVWIPTWYQAMSLLTWPILYQNLNKIADPRKKIFIDLYDQIIIQLQNNG